MDNDRIGAHCMGLVFHVVECALGKIGIADKQVGIPVPFAADHLANMGAIIFKFGNYRFVYYMLEEIKTHIIRIFIGTNNIRTGGKQNNKNDG